MYYIDYTMSYQVSHSNIPAHACPAAVDDSFVGSYAGTKALDIYYNAAEDIIFVRRGSHPNEDICHFDARTLLEGLEQCTPREAAIYRDVAQRLQSMD